MFSQSSIAPLIKDPPEADKGNHSIFFKQTGFNLDNFRCDDDSTLDDQCFNIVVDKQSQNRLHSSQRHSVDTMMPRSWHSIPDRSSEQSNEQELSPVPIQRQLINDFTRQLSKSRVTKELLDQSPDNLTKQPLTSQSEQSSEQLSFEFSGSDVPSQMLCYTTEAEETVDICNLESISETCNEKEEDQPVSTVKMVIVHSQNLSSQLQFAQKRKIVEDTNLPIFHKMRNKRPQEAKCKTLELSNADHTQKRSFRLFNDSDIGINLNKFTTGQEPIVDSCQDDDQETDEEVIEAGTQQCFQDLLVMKDFLISGNERMLKTFKLWAPKFNGQLVS